MEVVSPQSDESVVAAAVVLGDMREWEDIRDSKLLSAGQREGLCELIKVRAAIPRRERLHAAFCGSRRQANDFPFLVEDSHLPLWE